MKTPINLHDFLQSLHQKEVKVAIMFGRSKITLAGIFNYQPDLDNSGLEPNRFPSSVTSGESRATFFIGDVIQIVLESGTELPILVLEGSDAPVYQRRNLK